MIARPADLRARPGLAAVLLVALTGWGCNSSYKCSAQASMIPGPNDGGVSCLTSDDCPRYQNDIVCTTNQPPYQTCVECVKGICERLVPESC